MDKDAVRQAVWDDLEDSGVARFPFPPHGRIPNFAGADEAAERLTDTEIWAEATAIKANPDAPQRPVRRRALEAGTRLYMAVPRLRSAKPFLALDPSGIDDVAEASTIGGANQYGTPVDVADMPTIDLIVAGSVAVDERGTRIGKGEGYSDLEYAILREFGRVGDETPVVTTVHERQRWPDPLPAAAHDVPMDRIVTPERIIEPTDSAPRPTRLDWSTLEDERIEEIPVLDQLRGA